MTTEYIHKKFSELMYELSECNFSAINNEFYNKYVNGNEKFSEKQIQIFKEFAEDIVQEELTELSKKYIR